jgi:hypothetical protein
MLTIEQYERNERRKQAIYDSYSIEHQLAAGMISPAEAEAAKRRLMGKVTADVVSDGATYDALRDGERIVLAGDTDSDLQQLAQACGGYSEVHQLMRQPLGLEDLMNASEGYEGVSSLASSREQDAALRKVMHNRDIEAVQLGQISQEQFDMRASEREQDARRDRGESSASDDFDTAGYIERRRVEDEQRRQAEEEWRHAHGTVRTKPAETWR